MANPWDNDRIVVDAPDGTQVEFPAGTDATVMRDAMRRHYGGPAQPSSVAPMPPSGAPAGKPLSLNIEGRSVNVDQSFLQMSPDEQNRAVEEIAGSLKITPSKSLQSMSDAELLSAHGQLQPQADGPWTQYQAAPANPSTGLSSFRTQYPQYNDMSDADLTSALRTKFYPDMSDEDFNARLTDRGRQAYGNLSLDQRKALAMGAARRRMAEGGGQAEEKGPWTEWQNDRVVESGVFNNATAGLNSAIYSTLGAPVDAATWAVNKGIQGVNALTGAGLPEARNDLPGSSRSLAGGFNAVGVNRPEDVVPATATERVARALGEGAGYTIAPQAAVGGLARAGVGALAPRTMEALSSVTGQSSSAARTAGNAFAGGAAGAGSQGALEATDENDPYRSLYALGGGLAGGGVGSLVAGAPSALGAGARGAREWLDPITAGGRERLAGRQLRDAATSPSGAAQAIDTAPIEVVPGSRPTTFQMTGDMGLGSLERRVQTQYPAEFMARAGENNAARVGMLDQIQPGGAPEAVSRSFRDRLASIDSETESTLARASEAARSRAQSLGGNQTPEAYGESMRASLLAAESQARLQERALWQVVDPDNKLNVPTGNVLTEAQRIASSMPRTAAPMSGEEAAIFDTLRQLPGALKLNDVSALRSRLSTAMRTEMMQNGQSASYARMARLRGAVQDDLSGVIAQRADEDARAVAAGTLSEDQTMAAALARQVQEWRAANVGAQAAGAVAGGSGGGAVSRGTGRVLPVDGAQGQGFGRPGQPSGFAGPSGDAGGTSGLPFDDATRDRLSVATQATKDRAQTFGSGVNAQITRRSGQGGPYDVGPSSVPGRIFAPGPASADKIAQYRNAVGDAEALPRLQDYAASQLRRAAERPDGTLDPVKVASWRRSHADALRAFPDLDARFADAARASETMAEVSVARRARLDDYQKGVVGKLIGVDAPADVVRTVGGVFSRQDAASTMRQLADATRSDPAARDGLRKAVADYISGRFVGNTEAATTGQGALKSDGFQTFIRQNRTALRQVLDDGEIENLDRIAVDLQRASRSLYSVRIPGQSNTAQDLTRIRRDDTAMSAASRMMTAAGLAGAGGLTFGGGGVAGLAAAIGGAGVAALRQHGLTKVDDLIRDAMLDPQIARILLSKVSERSAESIGQALAARYKATAPAIGEQTEDNGRPFSLGRGKVSPPLPVERRSDAVPANPRQAIAALLAKQPSPASGPPRHAEVVRALMNSRAVA